MTEPEPAANPQAKTPVVDLVRDFVEALQRPGARCKVDGELWGLNIGDECQQEIVRLLSRPAADRGQIVEECARVAEQHASQYDHQHNNQENALWNECHEVAAAIRALSGLQVTREEIVKNLAYMKERCARIADEYAEQFDDQMAADIATDIRDLSLSPVPAPTPAEDKP